MTPDKVEAALGVVRGLRDEMKGLPHSLGYEYTHMAKVDEALATLTSALAERERDAARYRWLRDSTALGDGLDTAIDAAMKDTDCELSDVEIDATTDYRGHDPDYDRKDTDHAR